MVIKEIEKKSTEELKGLISELKAQLFMLRFQNSTRQLEQPHKIKIVKKDIARVFTVLNLRENKNDVLSKKEAPEVKENKKEVSSKTPMTKTSEEISEVAKKQKENK